MRDANPFFHRGPIRDPEYFVGRQTEVATIFEYLRNRQSIAISGSRRFGKTSLVFHVSNPIIAAEGDLPADTCRWIYLDGAQLSGLNEHQVYGEVARALGGSEESRSYAAFAETIRTFSDRDCRLVLLLDEFELVAANPRLEPAFFSRMRSLVDRFALQFITVSMRPLADLHCAYPDTLSSPFFNVFAPLRLDAFSAGEAKELLERLSTRAGHSLATPTMESVIEMVGTHPLFLHVAAYHAYPLLRNGEIADDDLRLVKARVAADIKGHLDYYWRNLDESAKYALAAMPLGGTVPFDLLTTSGLVHNGRYLGSVVERYVRQQTVPGLLQAGVFVLDIPRRKAALRGHLIRLTPTEFDALKLFLELPGRLLQLEDIEASLWPEDYAISLDRSRKIVTRLRTALGDDGVRIVNHRGQGYTIDID